MILAVAKRSNICCKAKFKLGLSRLWLNDLTLFFNHLEVASQTKHLIRLTIWPRRKTLLVKQNCLNNEKLSLLNNYF